MSARPKRTYKSAAEALHYLNELPDVESGHDSDYDLSDGSDWDLQEELRQVQEDTSSSDGDTDPNAGDMNMQNPSQSVPVTILQLHHQPAKTAWLVKEKWLRVMDRLRKGWGLQRQRQQWAKHYKK